MFDSPLQVDLRRALAGGALAALVTLLGMWLSGQASGGDYDLLLRLFLPKAQSFAETILLASATTLALMLTLLGLSSGGDSDLKPAHYIRIRQIAFGDTIVFVGAVTVALLLNVPVNESGKLEAGLEGFVYYGAIVTIVLMIYNAVADMISVLGLGTTDHPISDVDEEAVEEAAEEAAEEEAERQADDA